MVMKYILEIDKANDLDNCQNLKVLNLRTQTS
jgi:hypothetical protein